MGEACVVIGGNVVHHAGDARVHLALELAHERKGTVHLERKLLDDLKVLVGPARRELVLLQRDDWVDTLRKHGAEHGLGWASDAAANPAMRAQVMALRHDPQASALMAAELSASCRDATGQQITVEPAAMQKVLERHVRAHLDELAEVRPDFR